MSLLKHVFSVSLHFKYIYSIESHYACSYERYISQLFACFSSCKFAFKKSFLMSYKMYTPRLLLLMLLQVTGQDNNLIIFEQ